jgi:hypothetical protein
MLKENLLYYIKPEKKIKNYFIPACHLEQTEKVEAFPAKKRTERTQ